AHLEQGLALYAAQDHHCHALRYGQDPGVTCLSGAAATLWYLGYPAQARARIGEALSLAQRLSHPYSLAFALTYVGHLHQLQGDGRRAQEQAEALMALSQEHGFAETLAMGVSLRGWALAAQGQGEEGIEQMRQGVKAYQALQIELWRWYDAVVLAET